MTTQNTFNSQDNATKPTHSLRMKSGYGKNASFETIGVAWMREDGGFYIKLHGTQIIENGFYAFPIKEKSTSEGGL